MNYFSWATQTVGIENAGAELFIADATLISRRIFLMRE
jgi:hypothetical protein